MIGHAGHSRRERKKRRKSRRTSDNGKRRLRTKNGKIKSLRKSFKSQYAILNAATKIR